MYVARKKKSKVQKWAAGALLFFGVLLFMAGLYLLPIGTDAFLWFFVEVVAGGNWVLGDIYANAAALGMIFVGVVIMLSQGVRPGLKKTASRRRGK